MTVVFTDCAFEGGTSDYLEVYEIDGHMMNDIIHADPVPYDCQCDQYAPSLRSQSDQLYFYFTSDGQEHYKGFKFYWGEVL